MSRKTATASEEAHEQLFQHKRESESTSEFFERCADALQRIESGGAGGEIPDDVLTTDHIPDIVNTTSRRTADELEERMSRR